MYWANIGFNYFNLISRPFYSYKFSRSSVRDEGRDRSITNRVLLRQDQRQDQEGGELLLCGFSFLVGVGGIFFSGGKRKRELCGSIYLYMILHSLSLSSNCIKFDTKYNYSKSAHNYSSKKFSYFRTIRKCHKIKRWNKYCFHFVSTISEDIEETDVSVITLNLTQCVANVIFQWQMNIWIYLLMNIFVNKYWNTWIYSNIYNVKSQNNQQMNDRIYLWL